MTFLEQATANYVCDTCGQVRFKRQCEGHAFKDPSPIIEDTPSPRGDAMTREKLDAIRERLAAAKAWKPFTGSVDDRQRAMQDVEALLAEVERLRDALAMIAAPLWPTLADLWFGVETARKALKDGR